MTYVNYSVNLSDGHKRSLAKAYENKSELTLRLKNNQLTENFPLLLTATQINNINKAKSGGQGLDINILSCKRK